MGKGSSARAFLFAATGLVVALAAGCGRPLASGAARIVAPRVSPEDGMVQLYVPAGSFLMGSADSDPGAFPEEKPRHKVDVGAYWIDRTAVTNAMFDAFVAQTGYKTDAEKEGWGYVYNASTAGWDRPKGVNWRHPHSPTDDIGDKGARPVTQVSWNDAAAYAEWTGRRLPTEAEWENAARGSYGASDMTGNCWQWASDWFGEDYYAHSPARDPQGPAKGVARSSRGGIWPDTARCARATFRYRFPPGDRWDAGGFRCAETAAAKDLKGETAGPSSADLVIETFESAHSPIPGDENEYLILGNIPVPPPPRMLPPELGIFLGRWEGYDYSGPVKKDTKIVLVVQSLNSREGKAALWMGTKLQYPSSVKQIRFSVDVRKDPKIEFMTDAYGSQTKLTLSYDRDRDVLSSPADSRRYLELRRGDSFRVYKDYARYLAGKRIYAKKFRDPDLSPYGGQYLVYLPEGYEADSKRAWPLLMFLHGSGDRGTNPYLIAKASPFMAIREKGPLPFIIAAPLLGPALASDQLFPDAYLTGALAEFLADYRVDRARVYLTGLSLGGEATYRLAALKPHTFAAIAPLAAFMPSSPPIEAIKKLPAWIIHGENDTIVPLSLGMRPVEALKKAGGDIKLSILIGHDHDVWTDTYSDKAFYDWLLAHSHAP